MTWKETFAIFTLIMTTYFPHHWKDLTAYKPLILCTYHQFSSRLWLAYDQAFCQYAPVTRLMNWSSMNVQLFNFHAAGASLRTDSIARTFWSTTFANYLPFVEQSPLLSSVRLVLLRSSPQHLCWLTSSKRLPTMLRL